VSSYESLKRAASSEPPVASPARLPELTALLDGGQLRVPPLKTFELDQTGEALAEMAAGHVRGKLVITVPQP
jgi:NADPH:quinone reductase-like Zn-dependent oxidoreductase